MWRGGLQRVHRWLGLSLGLVLMVSGATGTLLLVAKPLDRAWNAALFAAPSQQGAAAPLQAVLDQLSTRYGSAQYTVRLPQSPGQSLLVYVKAPHWEGQAFFDPHTASLLGERGEREGLYNLLFELHSNLLGGDRGKAVLALSAVAFCLMLVSGVVLWWPLARKRGWRALAVPWRGSRLAFWHGLHRTAGVVAGTWALLIVGSGAYMAWRPISHWVTQASGTSPMRPPAAQPASAPARLDLVIARAQAAVPDGRVVYLTLPSAPTQPVRVRLRRPDDPHPNGLTSVWLDPGSGNVLASVKWQDLDPGARAYAWIYPFHSAQWWGTAHAVMNGAAGLALLVFGVSGLGLWWSRRQVARPQVSSGVRS
jgi:uncharacterized iron-regulated membrane protein